MFLIDSKQISRFFSTVFNECLSFESNSNFADLKSFVEFVYFSSFRKKKNYPTDPSLTGCKFSSDCKLLIIIFNHFLKENSKTEESELDSITLKLFYIYLLYCGGTL